MRRAKSTRFAAWCSCRWEGTPSAIPTERRSSRAHTFRTFESNVGCLSLTLGDFHEGWRYYEARRRHKAAKWTKLPGPEWRGEPLAGKRILLYAEQAFGDILQFARFVSVAADLGADVSFGVPGALCAFLGGMACRPTMIRMEARTAPLISMLRF